MAARSAPPPNVRSRQSPISGLAVLPEGNTAMQQFDPNIPGLIGGDITAVTVIDPANEFPGELGNHVLDRKDPFDVKVEWNVSGALATLWLDALKLDNNGNPVDWDVSVYAESLGGGPEIRLGTSQVPVDQFVHAYSTTVNVPALKLDEHDPGTDNGGIYKLVVAVFLNSDLGVPGYDMTGFFEGPIIQIEDPV
jgi:hypothetical protein